MKIIYLGDVVGKAGRNAVHGNLEELSRTFSPDFVIINGENSAHGFGITGKICRDFFNSGVDVIANLGVTAYLHLPFPCHFSMI